MTPLPDTRQTLIARLAEPADVAAWDEFVASYQTAIYRYCRTRGLQEADAAEVVQEVMLAVHQVVGQWQPSGRAGSFRAWLLETARRICWQRLRQRARGDRAAGGTAAMERLHEVADHAGPAAGEEAEWQRWAFCWAAGHVQRDVQPDTWRAFWLTAVEGVAPPVAAQRLTMSVGGVYAAKCRVLARIRQRIEELSR